MSPQTSDRNKVSQKNQNFCYYCETLIFDFSRHVKRNHTSQIFGQRIIASKKGYERNILLSELRKKGNYINAACGEIKLVKNPVTRTTPSKVKPCPNCHGFYNRKQLWRHKKYCTQKSPANTPMFNGTDFQKGSALLLTKEKRKHADLITKVFSRMQENLPNETAKKDELICEFGTKFFKNTQPKTSSNYMFP